MAKVLLGANYPGETVYGANHYRGIVGYYDTTSETMPRDEVFDAGTYSYFTWRLTANTYTAASTVTFRKNGASGNQSLSIDAAATGTFTDSSNTDSVAASDYVSAFYSPGLGGSATEACTSVVFESSSDTVTTLKQNSYNAFTTESVTYYGSLEGTNAYASSESTLLTKSIVAATLDNLRGYCSVNGRSAATTYQVRVNSTDVNGSISVTGSTTGEFHDASGSDSVSADDDMSYSITTGAGSGTITTQLQIQYTNTGTVSRVGNLQSAGIVGTIDPQYAPLTYWLQAYSTTEASFQQVVPVSMILSDASVAMQVNSVASNSTMKVRVNGADGNQSVSITASTTGWFTDSSGTDELSGGELVCYEITRGSTSGTFFTWATVMSTSATSGDKTATPSVQTSTFTNVSPSTLFDFTYSPGVQTATYSQPALSVYLPVPSLNGYNSFKKDLLAGNIDMDNDTLKVALVTSSYTFDQDSHTRLSDITNEVSGTGYTTGGRALSGLSVSIDTGNDVAVFNAADVTWANSTYTARGAVVYKDTGASGTSPLISYLDFSSDQSPSGENFTITWDALGMVRL